ncbi:hypothetical protein F4801DRAFT_543401 [Xylaria longipes]|nr:hypothetical protein F4801DRAFT_543401 [Xylaria longipes]RYC53589.1 hypothetical protein CHU98_g12619 [Xylaria longipes]
MQFTALIAAVSALAIGTNAAAIPRDGARLAQFRVFGADGCSALNYGFYTVDQSDVGTCHSLTTDPTAVVSVNLEHLEAVAAGCSLNIFTDTNCSEGERATTVNACANPAEAGETWGSWSITCPSSA